MCFKAFIMILKKTFINNFQLDSQSLQTQSPSYTHVYAVKHRYRMVMGKLINLYN